MVPESFNFLIKYRFTSLAPMGHRGSARDLKEALLADPPSTPTSGKLDFILKSFLGGIGAATCYLIFVFRRRKAGIFSSKWPKSCRNRGRKAVYGR